MIGKLFKHRPQTAPAAEPKPAEKPAWANLVGEQVKKLHQGQPGVTVAEAPTVLDQLNAVPQKELETIRSLFVEASPHLQTFYEGAKDSPLKGVATPQRLIRLLSGEAFGAPKVPTTVKEAVSLLDDALDRRWTLSRAAKGAEQRMVSGQTQPGDFQVLKDLSHLDAQISELRAAATALGNLRSEGAPVLTPRAAALLQTPLREGGPTVGELAEALRRGAPKLSQADVPALIDKLEDLNPVELKQLRRLFSPDRGTDALYSKLGPGNPLKSVSTPEKLVQMLAGVGYGQPALHTDGKAARAAAAKLTGPAQQALNAVADALDAVPRTHGLQKTSMLFEISARTGVKGVASGGYEFFVERGAVDRHTGKRKLTPFNAVFLRTPVTLNSYTWGAKGRGAEFGVNAPYVYASMGNPAMGPRAGIYIPLVANATVSGNGTIGGGIVLHTPIPLFSVGLSFYITDPRVLVVVDPALDAVGRAARAVKKFMLPVRDALHDLFKKDPAPNVSGRPVLATEVLGADVALDWDATLIRQTPALKVGVGEALQVAQPLMLEVAGRRVEVSLAAPLESAQISVTPTDRGLELRVDGQAVQLPFNGSTPLSVVVGATHVFARPDGQSSATVTVARTSAEAA